MRFKVFVCEPDKIESTLNEWAEEMGDVSIGNIATVVKPRVHKQRGKNEELDFGPEHMGPREIIITICYEEKKGAPRKDPGYGDDPLAPDCPKCGLKMVQRRRGRDGNPFWGCSTFPSCNGIVQMGREEMFRRPPANEPMSNPDFEEEGFLLGDDEEVPF